jgi:hypothetical protein
LRELDAAFVLAQGNARGGTANTIQLAASENSNDDFYNHTKIIIEANTGVGQERIIVDYDGTTKTATIAPPWVTTPDTSSDYIIEPAISHAETNSKTVKVGLAAAATSSTITLASDASSTDDFYNNDVVIIDAGTGEGQERIITDYNGTTKVATINPDWTTTPDTTSEYLVEEALTVAALRLGVMEATALPGVDDSLEDKLNLLYSLLVNKATKSTAGAFALRNSADGADVVTGTDTDDGTTYTRGGLS